MWCFRHERWHADLVLCGLQVGTCLLESCQGQLAGCLTDGNCIKNLVCLNKCNNREDESDCQVTANMGAIMIASRVWYLSKAPCSDTLHFVLPNAG